jgi:hypothetical protein
VAAPEDLSRIERLAEPLVEALLFADEAPLEAPVEGTSSFASEFEAKGPFDGEGRSLRKFDLRTRLFRFPLSYLVYSASFDALPNLTKSYVFRRLREELARSPEEGRAALEILEETKPAFASSSGRDDR